MNYYLLNYNYIFKVSVLIFKVYTHYIFVLFYRVMYVVLVMEKFISTAKTVTLQKSNVKFAQLVKRHGDNFIQFDFKKFINVRFCKYELYIKVFTGLIILYMSLVLFQSVKTIHINGDSLHNSKNASNIQNQPYQIENKQIQKRSHQWNISRGKLLK